MSNLDFMEQQLEEKNDKSKQSSMLFDNVNDDLKSENGKAIIMLTVLYVVITTTLIVALFI